MSNPMLEVCDLRKWYPGPPTLAGVISRNRSWVKAVDEVSLAVWPAETLGVIGESGCGKSSLGRTLVRLEDATGGSVVFDGQDITGLSGPALKRFRRRAQMIFQNPYETFDARYDVRESLERPLIIHGIGDRAAEREERVLRALDEAGLRPAEAFAERYPHELSGGQLQRVSVARAMLLGPDLVVADEPVSMLDVSVRAGILNTLLQLRSTRRASIVFITHDIAVARYVSDRLAVMYLGKIVETGPAEQVIAGPVHPYTRALIAHSPDPDPDSGRPAPIPVKGEPPTPLDPPPGCRFAPRCPLVRPECRATEPRLEAAGAPDTAAAAHLAACHVIRKGA